MTLLPNNEGKKLCRFEEAIGSCINNIPLIHAPLHPNNAPLQFLPYIAKSYDVNIVGFSEAEARDILSMALWNKAKIGTIVAVKNLLACYDQNAKLTTYATAPKHDGKTPRNGTIRYKAYGLSHWAMYHIELTKPISLTQKETLMKELELVAPARCVLVLMDAQSTFIHDGTVKRNGTYTYGGYING